MVVRWLNRVLLVGALVALVGCEDDGAAPGSDGSGGVGGADAAGGSGGGPDEGVDLGEQDEGVGGDDGGGADG
ncbi:MAG: hypothetical protein H6705_10300, partial [Myxococcales bacterium]|nr:hypothetical protein [Myxococcales bacterium]